MMVGFQSPELALAGRTTGTETPHPTLPHTLKSKAEVNGRTWRAEGHLWSFGSERTCVAVGRRGRLAVRYPTAVRRDAVRRDATWGWSRIPHPAFTVSRKHPWDSPNK